MGKETPVFLVLGCGENGLEWANKRNEGELVIGLDHKNIQSLNPNFKYGDVLKLPFEEMSANRIYADFILNAVSVRNISFRDIKNNPSILRDESFPKIVRDWFTDSLNGSEAKVRDNPETIRWLLRTQALREMMRVLKINGEIFIIDRPHIVNWIRTETVNIFGIDSQKIEIENLAINSDDHMRSASLRDIAKDNEPLGKISVKKLHQ
ncbi:MAG: class I SAM-dependent methyltransferase [Candidatus Levybacteria bacterium]|nr:class I SAM-dependent methyltransferase [Candidatus Levybacteria bacterium]